MTVWRIQSCFFKIELFSCIWQFSCPSRKKLLTGVDPVADGAEAIDSSSSQDEADAEHASTKFRKRRRILRKNRLKNKFKSKRLMFVLKFL